MEIYLLVYGSVGGNSFSLSFFLSFSFPVRVVWYKQSLTGALVRNTSASLLSQVNFAYFAGCFPSLFKERGSGQAKPQARARGARASVKKAFCGTTWALGHSDQPDDPVASPRSEGGRKRSKEVGPG